ncbi:(2Fe-2S) ferredoxin domain-containing protein [Feifania hominis]|uniref:(2Fe-2S) ferredoxin domain-containing protein n=1 Tax=Feifania hominis TaxID=2763660 RepID=A0A926HV57_9FIRM|nr:(2Fe-2S) ferredoxin domain-containing protein [Feifania hominis]MBC8536256.1 (2Fe-2S) ferredoxin domain-containing protein [Feifania hominis]
MLDVFVCIGSSCHLRGSYDIIGGFKSLIEQHGLQDKVNLSASFCLGHCTDGVTVKVGEEFVTGLNKENCEEKFNQHILSRVK